MKNQKQLIILAVILIVLAGGFYFLVVGKSKTQELPVTASEQVPTLAPADIGLSLVARADNKAVKFTISKASDITSVDYELSYLAKGDIPRGAIGHAEPQGGVVTTNYIELGSCSSGKCKYDEGVTSVKLVLKITKTNGQAYEVTQSLDLTQ